jgi:hypothetical protein
VRHRSDQAQGDQHEREEPPRGHGEERGVPK